MNYKKSLFIGLFSLILFSNLFALEIEYVTYEGFGFNEYKEVYLYFNSDVANLELNDLSLWLDTPHPEYWNSTINLISLSTLGEQDYNYKLTATIQAIQEQVMDEINLHLEIISTANEDSYKLKVVIDKPFTLLDDDEQKTMAERFLPIMLLDSGEEGGIPDYPEIYYPKEIGVLLDALGNTATINDDDDYIADATLEYLAKYNSSDYKIHFFMDDDISGGNHVINTWYQDHFNEIEINYNTQLYASFIEDENFVVLTYWFYYLYNNNDWDPLGLQTNHHISDWEGMTLIFNSNGFNQYSDPIYAATSSHMKFGTKKPWNEIYKVEDHPVVFVCNGSHATYFVPGHSSNEGGFLQDFHYGEGVWVLPVGISENDVLAISDLQSYFEGYSGEIIHFGVGGSSSDQVEILERLNNIDTDQLENYWHSFGGLWGQSYLFGKIESYSPSGPPFIESNDDGTITNGYKWFHPYLWYEAQREDHTIIVDEDNVDLSIENGVLTGTITLQLLYNGSYITQTLFSGDFSVYALKNGSIDYLNIDNVDLNGTTYTLTIEDDFVDLDPGFYDIEIHYGSFVSDKFGIGYIKNYEILDTSWQPTVTIISPWNYQSFEEPDILVEGEASDPDGYISLVQVKVNDGVWQNADGTDWWSINVTLSEGYNDIHARAKDNDNNWSDEDIVTIWYGPPLPPTLSVTPHYLYLPVTSGTTTFTVNNVGSGTMDWTASEDVEWFSINPSSGTNYGVITVSYETNDGDPRSGTITIEAPGAENSPQTVDVFQNGNDQLEITLQADGGGYNVWYDPLVGNWYGFYNSSNYIKYIGYDSSPGDYVLGRHVYNWDISGLSDVLENSTINSAIIQMYQPYNGNSSNIKFYSIENNPSEASAQTLWNDCNNGIHYQTIEFPGNIYPNNTVYFPNNYGFNNKIHSQLSEGWVAIGLKNTNESSVNYLIDVGGDADLVINYTPNPALIYGHVSLNGGTGNITDVTIKLDKQGSPEYILLHPDTNGDFSYTLSWINFGTYDIIYSLDGYISVILNNIQIDEAGDIILPDVELDPTGSISGNITLSGDGNGQITDVEIKAGGIIVNPDASGYYYIELPVGTYDVKASLPAYNFPTENGVVIENGTITTVDLNLNYTGIILVSQDEDWHFTTIQDGINAAQNGESVCVDDGIYTGHNLNWFWLSPDDPKHIIVESIYGPDNCIIDIGVSNSCGFNFDNFIGCNYNSSDIVEGFTIKNGGNGIIIENGSPVIKNNIIKECTDHGIKVEDGSPLIENNIIKECGENENSGNGAGIYCISSATIQNNIIENNINNWPASTPNYGGGIYIENNTDDPVNIICNIINGNKAHEGGALYCTGSGTIIIDNNEITNNSLIFSDEGTELGDCEGICCCECEDLEISNNLIHNNKEAQYRSGNAIYLYYNTITKLINNTVVDNDNLTGIYVESSNLIFKNNIIAYNLMGIWRISGTHPTLSYSNFWSNTNGNYNPQHCIIGPGVIEEDPWFNNPSIEDYSLYWEPDHRSPCIDTGDPATDWDADNTPPDMGAIPAVPHDYDHRTLTVGDDINWISLPILDTRTTGYTAPEKALEEMGLKDPTILDKIIYEDEIVIEYDDDGILHIDPEFEEFRSIEGYKIRLKESPPNSTIGITGFREDPSTPIEMFINKYNWIGYFLDYSQPALDAFSSIPWFSIKAKNWYLSHEYPKLDKIKDRYSVNPGELYIVTVTANCNLVWEEGEPIPPPPENTHTEYFSYTERLDYMPIMCDTVYGDTTLIEISVFDGNTCIGASVVEKYPVQILAYIEEDSTKDGGDELTFYLYGGGKSESCKVNGVAVFDPVTSAFVDKPVYLDKDNFVIVRLNTEEAPEITREFTLYQNYPNPVSNSTTICFLTTKNTKDTKIEIYNIKGQLVKQLSIVNIQSSIEWDGKDENGKFLANGIYFYKLISGEKSAIKKMVILR